MQRIKVQQAETDMVIAQPVEATSGQVLCAKGTTLTANLISRLEQLDITHITVQGHPVDDENPIVTLEEEIAELDLRFRAVMDNKLMAALKMVVHKHIEKKHAQLAEELQGAENGDSEAEAAQS